MKKLIALAPVSLLASIMAISLSGKENEIADKGIQPAVIQQFLEEAKKNSNWKMVVATGEQEQIVFMNVSPLTNSQNEIGMEIHPFDQAILIVEGKGEAILNGEATPVQSGTLIFVPKDTPHNVINRDRKKELKLISFYSKTDIPAGAIYKKKTDVPNE